MCPICWWPLSAECAVYKNSEHCCSVLSQWVQGANVIHIYIHTYRNMPLIVNSYI